MAPRPGSGRQLRADLGRHWYAIGTCGVVIGLSAQVAFWYAFQLNMSTEEAVTLSFLTFGFARLWRHFNMRDRDASLIRNEATTNRYVWIALVIGILLLLAATYLPVLSEVLGTAAPSAEGWALIAAGSLVPPHVGQVAKIKALRRLLPGLE